MDDDPELGPIDYVVVEFPPGTRDFSGAMARELASLVDAEMVRLLDLLVVTKAADGTIEAYEVEDLARGDELRGLEGDLAEILTFDDVAHLATAIAPGTIAAAMVWENTWAVPFAAAARASGGQLVATGRIHNSSVVAALDAPARSEGT